MRPTKVTEPRRRGRPPGSKNKPKVIVIDAPLPIVTQPQPETIEVQWDTTYGAEAGRPAGSSDMEVQLRYGRRAFGEEPKTEMVWWPRDWPLPGIGSNVIVAEGGWGGMVQHLSFDLAKRIVVIELR